MIPENPPIAGTVLRYSYLWRREADQGRDEGEKDRPVALLLAKAPGTGECLVCPITHTPPDDAATAIEIPAAERARLGLDNERSWIVVAEINAFVWPGPDLRPIPSRNPSTVIYGQVSKGLYQKVLAQVQALVKARMFRSVPRT